MGRLQKPGTEPDSARSVPALSLELSGPKLALAFQQLANAAEDTGGLERYVDALKLKGAFFSETLGGGRARGANYDDFRALFAWMSTVRRRIGVYVEPENFERTRAAVAELLEGSQTTAGTDARIAAFCARFPEDRAHRWVHDAAAEILHHVDAERYPLMTRWVWDARTNTGVLREIWHGEDVDLKPIPVPAAYETFVALRAELAQFLTAQGVFRDVMHYVDLLAAQVYAAYIHEQGGSYLRADFANSPEPMLHVKRLLGLDGIDARGRSRLKAANGTAVMIERNA